MKWQKDRALPTLQFEQLPADIPHAVFTRQGGVSVAPYATLNLSESQSDERANVMANRARAYGVLGRTSDTTVNAHLVHGADVLRVGAAHYGRYNGPADALITDEPGVALAMNFADCAPILLYDPEHRAIGLGHAGWKGAVVDLSGAMVRAMTAAFGSEPAQLWAGVGPAIGPCCYEVDEPLIGEVRGSFAEAETLLIPQNGRPRPHFDLPAANRRRLQDAGVTNIEMAGYCTACRTDLFFSHRAEKGRTGRFGVLMVLP